MRDYRYTIIETLSELAGENLDMTFGDMLYSVMRGMNKDLKIENMREKFNSLTDLEWYQLIEKTLHYERED